LKFPRLDSDRKTADLRLPPVEAQGDPVASRLEQPHFAQLVAFGHQVANEIAGIAFGLEADNVVLQQQWYQLLVLRQRGQNLRRRKRNVQEKPDPVGVPAPPQGVRDGNQMIVVYPDQIVVFDDFFELGREMIIHPEIAAEIAAREFGEVQPVVQDWPQHPIGEAVVIFLKVVLRQVGDDIFDVLVPDGARFQPVRRSDIAAPAEPDTAVPVERRSQRDFETAGALGAVAGRNRNPVGNDH
jgi:hypothetical protein